jgi:cytochrome c oxidase subunit IV
MFCMGVVDTFSRALTLRFRWAICVSFMRMHEQLLLGGCVSMIFEKLETIHQEYLFLLLIVVEVTQNLAGCPSLYDSQSSLVGYAHYAVFFTSPGVRKSNVGSKRTGCGF